MVLRNSGDPPLEISALPSSLWESLNVLLSVKLSSVHGLLGMDAISTSTACRDFNTVTVMQQSLTHTDLLKAQPRAKHSPSTLELLANQLKKSKNGARKGMKKQLRSFLSAVRAHINQGLSCQSQANRSTAAVSNEARSGLQEEPVRFCKISVQPD